MLRASSGSRSSINSIEPLISANNAVTVLRSPSYGADDVSGPIRISGWAVFAGSVWAAGGGDRDVPHSPQKSSPGSLDAPHFGQRRASGPPHFAQNLRPSLLSLPHLEQRINSPFRLKSAHLQTTSDSFITVRGISPIETQGDLESSRGMVALNR